MPWTVSFPRLHYELRRPASARVADRPAVILIHELGGSSWSWNRVAHDLAEDHAVLSFDQRGAGLSDRPAEPFEPQALVEDLQRVLHASALAPPYCVASIAGGAGVAAAFALARPECVAGVALCSPTLEMSERARGQLLARADRVEREGMQVIADDGLAHIYPIKLRGEEFADYRRRWLAQDALGFALLSRALARTTLALNELGCPCLVLAGRLDIRPVEQMVAAAQTLRCGRFALVELGGHLLPVQAPEPVARELRAFVASLGS